MMKVFAVLLSLLGLSLLQEALCTHLETCECHEIQEMVNTTVDKAVAGLEHRLSQINSTVTMAVAGLEQKMGLLINGINTTTDSQALKKLEKRLTTTVQNLLQPIQDQLNYHLPPPPHPTPPSQPNNSQTDPAISCKDLNTKFLHATSGYYWIGESGSAVRVYCSMEGTCGNETGGWMRVANIDMRNTSHTCPSGLTLFSSSKRVCGITSGRCASKAFSTHGIQYSHVCGKIIGYQYRNSLAFIHGSRGIDSDYVYGVSLTHGSSPRKHIWTFAGAVDESGRNPSFQCSCNHPSAGGNVPSFVGNDYFCDTALNLHYINYPDAVHIDDPLWDGKGCSSTNHCCSFNNPPWFTKDLPSPTTNGIEMRVCKPDPSGSTPIETVELYVQ